MSLSRLEVVNVDTRVAITLCAFQESLLSLPELTKLRCQEVGPLLIVGLLTVGGWAAGVWNLNFR